MVPAVLFKAGGMGRRKPGIAASRGIGLKRPTKRWPHDRPSHYRTSGNGLACKRFAYSTRVIVVAHPSAGVGTVVDAVPEYGHLAFHYL